MKVYTHSTESRRNRINREQISDFKAEVERLTAELAAAKVENEALLKIMQRHQQTIAVMAYDLLNKGINFDFAKVEERHAALKEASK